MKKRIIKVIMWLIFIILVGFIAHFVGYSKGLGEGKRYQKDFCEKHLHQPMAYWDTVVELDKSFMQSINWRPSTMVSGSYVFVVQFHHKPAVTNDIEINFVDGQLQTTPPLGVPYAQYKLKQSGNIVSWSQRLGEERGYARYVGVINGDTMWGRVYIPRNEGWHNHPPEIGVWKIYPKLKVNPDEPPPK